MKKRKIICLVGKTGTGKDTCARYLEKEFGYSVVCSYTTRPKRDYETDGVQHYFVSKERMKEIIATEHVIAYTINEKTGIEYCATAEAIEADKSIYIINPEGVAYLRKHNDGIFDLLVVYLSLPEEEIENRVKIRGDNFEVFRKRIESEREEFDSFYEDGDYDVAIPCKGLRESEVNSTLATYIYLLNEEENNGKKG